MEGELFSVQAVIYDLDGVLVNTRRYHFDALNKALAVHGYEITPEEQLLKYEGLPTTSKLEILTREKGLPQDLYAQIVDDKYQEIARTIETYFQKDQSKIDLVGRVGNLGIRQVVCTNTTKSTTDRILEIMEIDKYFEFCLTRADIEKPKPDPEIYNNAISRLKIRPTEVLILEDSDHGLAAARASGARVLRIEFVDQVNFDYVSQYLKV